jgi:hypothetical protein
MFESSYLRAVTGIQYAAAGVNTHINFDLALALVDTWQALGPPDVGGRQRADYDRVTDIFGELYEQFRADLLSQDLEKFDKGLVQVALNLASHFVVDKARDAAWVSATEIYRVRKWKFGRQLVQEPSGGCHAANRAGHPHRPQVSAPARPVGPTLGLVAFAEGRRRRREASGGIEERALDVEKGRREPVQIGASGLVGDGRDPAGDVAQGGGDRGQLGPG